MLHPILRLKNTQQYFCEQRMRENGMVHQLCYQKSGEMSLLVEFVIDHLILHNLHVYSNFQQHGEISRRITFTIIHITHCGLDGGGSVRDITGPAQGV